MFKSRMTASDRAKWNVLSDLERALLTRYAQRMVNFHLANAMCMSALRDALVDNYIIGLLNSKTLAQVIELQKKYEENISLAANNTCKVR